MNEHQLRRIEQKLDLILKHLGLADALSEESEQWQDYVHEGKKLNAVKEYRERYGVGLKDAKDAVEEYMKNYDQEY